MTSAGAVTDVFLNGCGERKCTWDVTHSSRENVLLIFAPSLGF